MSVHWPIIRRCLFHPLQVGVVDDQRSYRRGMILAAAMTLADEIEKRSTSKTVGILLPTGGLFPIAALAGWILDRVIVPLNYLLKPEELRYVVQDCGADTIVTVQAMIDYMGGPSSLPDTVKLIRMEQLDFKSVPSPRWPALNGDDELALLLYTSGTSGRPKGVMLSHGNLSANIRQIIEWTDFDSREVVLGVLPQFHTFGLTVLTLLPLTVGCKAVYTARFMPAKIVRLFRAHKPTAFIAIPSMYNALLHVKDAGPQDFSTLKFTVSGGEPLPTAVADAFKYRFGVTIAEGYGLTETAPVTNWCRPDEYRAHSVGRALPRVTERIVSIETGEDLGTNQDGEIRIAGPNVMKGYFHMPAETDAAFDERGFFRTGDIGRFDDAGHLYITGRLKEMLIIGGENVFPREIEEVLNAHPSVKDSGVVGKKDAMRGELPVAFVEMKDQPHAAPEGTPSASSGTSGKMPFDEKALIQWCRSKLAGYKVPDEIKVLDALPRNPTGKVVRRELRKLVAGAD